MCFAASEATQGSWFRLFPDSIAVSIGSGKNNALS
jgi:hypothetical protein